MWVTFASFTAGEWIAILSAVSTLLVMPILGYLKTRNLEAKMDAVAVEEKEKAKTLVTQNAEVTGKLDDILTINTDQTVKLNKVHTLVNGPHRAAVRKVAELARWKADREPTPENIKAAVVAEDALRLNLLSPEEN